jgi:Kdo2-lipid IVA lauroyltransferase/acyltransferase
MYARLERGRQLLTYLAVRVFICVVQTLPMDACERLAGLLATLCCDILGIRRRIVEENLRHAMPGISDEQRRELAWRMWRHLFLLVAEVAHAPRKIHETNWRQFVRLDRSDILVRALLDDRPVLLVSGHFGNFELAGFVLGILGFPTYTVARTLDNPYLDAFVNRFRGATGQHIIPKNGGYDQILSVLRRGGTMAFLADQYAGSKGCWVNFFGRPASAHKAIALFALDNNAPLVVGYARRLDNPLAYELAVQDIADPQCLPAEQRGIRELTQRYTAALEAVIRRQPDQYWWLHDRWKDKRGVRSRRRNPRAA